MGRSLRHEVERVRKNAGRVTRSPRLILREINRRYHSKGQEYNPNGIDIFKEDWDNLIILDACRVGAFREIVEPEFSGTFQTKESRGSATAEWIKGNFTGKCLHDTVYVTGSSWILRLQDEIRAELHNVIPLLDRGIDGKQEAITQLAREAATDYPRKRLIVHYTSPHHPYEGSYARENLPPLEEQRQITFFEDILMNRLDTGDEALRIAHKENLEQMLPSLRVLISELDGRTVITSDHTDLLGERIYPIPMRDYGHPRGYHVDELVTVPWFEVASDIRREIIPEPPEDLETHNEEQVSQQLRDLGYAV